MISSQALKTLFFGLLLMLAVSASNAAVAMDHMDATIPEDNIGGSGISLDAIPEDNTAGGLGMRFLRGTTEDQGHRKLCKTHSQFCTSNSHCCSGDCTVFFCFGN